MLLQHGNLLQSNNTDITFQKGDIRIQDQRIKECAPLLLPHPGEDCLDLEGDYVLPGMVNSHSHSYTNLLRGASYGEPLEIWSADTIALGGVLSNEDMALSTTLGICEMIRGGVTACVDHLPHLKTAACAADVYRKSCFRAALAPMLHNLKDTDILVGMKHERLEESVKLSSPFPTIGEFIDFYEDFIRQYHDPLNGLQVMTGINSPQRADDALLEAAAALSSKHGLSVHCHLLETRWQKLSALKDATSPLAKLDRYSLLHEHTSLAHCLWLDDEELDLLAERNAIPVSNPSSNLFLGSGIFPAGRYLERGILPALGSDGVNCGSSNNMLEILRLFLLLQRSCEADWSRWISGADAWSMVTARGRDVLNLHTDAAYGNLLSPGQPADLAIAAREGFLDISGHFLSNQLLFHNHPVFRHVLIGGNFVMKAGKITVIDEDGLRYEISRRKDDLKRKFSDVLKKAQIEKEWFARRYKEMFLNRYTS